MENWISKNNKAWNDLFEKFNIINAIETNGFFEITADQIKESGREPRLMTKFDSSENLPSIFAENNLAILPIKRGSYIILDKQKDKLDQVVAFARHRQGRTLLVIANKNVNRRLACKIEVPSLKANQKLDNLLPSYGEESKFQISQGEVAVDLGPGRIHVFEIDTPYIESYTKNVYKQH